MKKKKVNQVTQGAIGRLLHFGTITLLNIRRLQLAQKYLIHNPQHYALSHRKKENENFKSIVG